MQGTVSVKLHSYNFFFPPLNSLENTITHRSEQEALREKLQNLEKKILVGGENLLEKADLQGQLLLQSAQELEQTMSQEQLLQQELQRKEVCGVLIFQFKMECIMATP